MKLKRIALVAALAAGIMNAGAAMAQDKLSIVVFGWPSLGAFLPPIIKAQKLDAKHNLDITFAERTPDAYTAQFNSGEFPLGGSAALLTVGLADIRGVKVSYLFNLFDFWGAVVTSRPQVQSVKDLEGKEMAAARGTTNFVMFDWFARRLGVDTSKIAVVNTATPGLIGYALADRADAVQLWEPAWTGLMARKPDIRTLDLAIEKNWKAFAGSNNIPYLGVAAHQDWIDKNRAVIPRLYQAYADAADWVKANPVAAAKLMDPKGTDDSRAAIVELIKNNERLGMNLRWAHEVKKEIQQVYSAGREVKFLPSEPGASTIYEPR
ncbi:MAG: ABC transporter substrate-binding protein [Beijerinckiaceae bacterium]|nr:ABC transporter substrate-binding protein [Beijerinckiaceae bacterium]